MKKHIILVLIISFIVGACNLMLPRNDLRIGMTERQFLRRYPSAVINNLERDNKIYRVQRDDYFFALVAFEGRKLVNVEERELPRRFPGPGEIYFERNEPRP